MDRPKPRCRFLLRYGGNLYCREVWTTGDVMAPPTALPHGCPEDCSAYRADIYDRGEDDPGEKE